MIANQPQQLAASDTLTIRGLRSPLEGQVTVPGDKSISHRAVILGSIAEGTTRIRNFLPANDCLATIEAIRALGIEIQYEEEMLLIHGRGLSGLQEPARPLDCGGSGTTMRLLAGLLAGQPFYSVLMGNAQLSRRPMDRVIIPLRQMGATLLARGGGKYPPISVSGGNLSPIRYQMPVASAQVKSAVLLAGLFANGVTIVEEPAPSRDHTERMLSAMGANVHVDNGVVHLEQPQRLNPLDIRVPGDLSSAAFILAAAAIVPGSSVTVPGVGVNEWRSGVLRALRAMGADLRLNNRRVEHGEPVADLELQHSPLAGITVPPREVPAIIDELPVLAVIATQAAGVTRVMGAAELRVKETDRIATTVGELRKLGARIEATPDGFFVEGPTRLRGAAVSSRGDHRLAMSLAIAGLAAEGETTIEDTACIRDSFPGFEQALLSLSRETAP
ncbi:MAG: 3-phosphoshikimate 1-carboxyvinyltransferase [Chloroflexia bacterium]